ncbi:integrase core domain-containing protein [Ralstonia pseudosolanacearum]|uniref:transposase n=1 Tax=Ralstonia pseudosolanacearum TaxID=1310165 RepID=UPI001E2CDE43|nr:transposase [Ralstonia pseudosolanacearum]
MSCNAWESCSGPTTEEWLREYNEQRPHDALGGLPPRRFMPRLTTVADSSNAMSA